MYACTYVYNVLLILNAKKYMFLCQNVMEKREVSSSKVLIKQTPMNVDLHCSYTSNKVIL